MMNTTQQQYPGQLPPTFKLVLVGDGGTGKVSRRGEILGSLNEKPVLPIYAHAD